MPRVETGGATSRSRLARMAPDSPECGQIGPIPRGRGLHVPWKGCQPLAALANVTGTPLPWGIAGTGAPFLLPIIC